MQPPSGMKPKTVRDLLISLGLSAGLGAAGPACGSSLTVSNPPPPDGSSDVANPPPPDSGSDTAAGGRGGTGGVSNPPPGGSFGGGGATAGSGGSGGAGGGGGNGGTGGSGFGGFGGGNVFPPRPDASGDLGGSPDAESTADGGADGSEADGHEAD